MNDPEEGIVLLKCLNDTVRLAFENASLQEEDNIYIGSFLPANRHEDELIMWRTYGKDEIGIEGGGCSIVIETSFFDIFKEDAYLNPEFSETESNTIDLTTGDAIVKLSSNAIKVSYGLPQCLHRVLYYNNHHDGKEIKKFDCVDGEEIEKDLQMLDIYLQKLVHYKDNPTSTETELDKAINKIIYHLISEVRFFFKSADYAFENEVRVLQFVPKNSNELQIDEYTKPKRVFINSNKPIQPYIDKIILGPKVPNPKQWLYLDVEMKRNNPKPVSILISECKYQ